MNIIEVTDAYTKQKKEMLVVAKACLLEHFNNMFANNPAITGAMWTQGIGGEGWDRRPTVDEIQLTTAEDPINADYDVDSITLYPETGECLEGIDYEYFDTVFFKLATNYYDSDAMLLDMFPSENGVKIIVTREGFHTEDYIY